MSPDIYLVMAGIGVVVLYCAGCAVQSQRIIDPD